MLARASAGLARRLATRSTVASGSKLLHTCPPTAPVLLDGCAPFMSRATVDQISQQWQGGLLELLNQEVRETEFATSSIVETVIGLANKREQILAFNYASQALNNSFFLSALAPQQSLRHPAPLPKLANAISKSFESFPEMCLAFSSAAFGMSGSGWVWLVTDQHRNLGIVPTYGAGTVIVQNRMQQGKHFMIPSINDQTTGADSKSQSTPSPSSPSAAAAEEPFVNSARPVRGMEAVYGALGLTDQVGKEIYPLLNISVHEHTWLNDYGIMGKEEYLTRFWNCVNWVKVEERFEAYCPQSSRVI